MLAYLAHLRANPAYLRLAGEIELHEPKLYRRAVADWLERITTRIQEAIIREKISCPKRDTNRSYPEGS